MSIERVLDRKHSPTTSSTLIGVLLRYALVSKETYYRGKRDLIHSRKRPTMIVAPELRHPTNHSREGSEEVEVQGHASLL